MEETKKIKYCGIILKDTLEAHQEMMYAIGFLLANKNWVLRTSGDLGIPNPFEAAAKNNAGIVEKLNFNDMSVQVLSCCNKLFPKEFVNFSEGKQKYIGNLVGSILGKNCDEPAKFVMLASNKRKTAIDIKKICTQNKIDYYDIYTSEGVVQVQQKIDILVKRYIHHLSF